MKCWLGLLLLFSLASAGSLCSGQERVFVGGERTSLGTEVFRSASIRTGDLNGDQQLDLVVANGRHWPEQDYIFLNQGKAKFSIMRPLGTDRTTTYACEVGDLDGDGDLDIVSGNDLALGRIFLNDGSARFTEHGTFGEISSVRSVTLADVDEDRDLIFCRLAAVGQIEFI